MVYISEQTDVFYLNRTACRELGIISKKFPTIGEKDKSTSTSAIITDQTRTSTTTTAPCGCPTRTMPPPLPKPPVKSTDINREELEQFLLEYYKSSTFNTCTHQPLPMMSGPPMKLTVDPEATPVAIHKAIPVPIHFKEQVKADLDRDVHLGVIERVPMSTPTTWCHRMVICPKKDSTPR